MAYVPAGKTIVAFHESPALVRALIGPIAGGRATACATDMLGKVLGQAKRGVPGERVMLRWAVVAPSLEVLEEKIISVWHSVVPETHGRFRSEGQERSHFVPLLGAAAGELEVRFYAWELPAHRRRLAALETTGAWLANARDLPEEALDDMLAAVGNYPPPGRGDPVWFGVIISSRMPDAAHWLLNRQDVVVFRQPSGRSPDAENLQNLGSDFYLRLEHRLRNSPERQRSDIDAEPRTSAAETVKAEDRERVRESFREYVLRSSNLRPAVHHELLIEKLESVERGEIRRLMIFLPPGSGKSLYSSVWFPAWWQGRHPTLPVICASHTRELAERFGRQVRAQVSEPLYTDVFGVKLSGESAAAGRWTNSRGGEYVGVGVGGALTGRRGHLQIIDDPVKSRADADSPTSREAIWQWYRNVFWTRLMPDGAIILIMTRWHEDDLAGRLLAEAERGGEQWEVVSVPAIAEEGVVDPLGRKPGERLWAEWFSEAMFAEAQRDGRTWSALYQQRPMPESGDFFQRGWLKYYDQRPPLDRLRRYGACDAAVTEGGGDFTVNVAVGVDADDNIYILDLLREQSAPDIWVDRQLDMIRRWRIMDFCEEKGQLARSVGPFRRKRAAERRINFVPREIAPVGDKAARAQSFRARLAQGRVLFPRQAPWLADVIAELLAFPAGKYDDCVDAFALIGQALDKMTSGPRPAPVEEFLGGMPYPGVSNPPPMSIEWLHQNAAGPVRRGEERI
jgi:predicted phage terminase large subunit-like protein